MQSERAAERLHKGHDGGNGASARCQCTLPLVITNLNLLSYVVLSELSSLKLFS